MKVCTDACLLGAYAASELQGNESNVLDIGTGTGLLALMLAQKTNAQIDAVEIQAAAAKQASQNVLASPWATKVQVIHNDIKYFYPNKKYDCIISNPPFFEADLRSADEKKNDAKHDSGLTLSELINTIKFLLSDTGNATLLLPFARTAFAKKLVTQAGLYISASITVRPSPTHPFFRTILAITKQPIEFVEESFSIHDEQRNYSARFSALLKDYYLKL